MASSRTTTPLSRFGRRLENIDSRWSMNARQKRLSTTAESHPVLVRKLTLVVCFTSSQITTCCALSQGSSARANVQCSLVSSEIGIHNCLKHQCRVLLPSARFHFERLCMERLRIRRERRLIIVCPSIELSMSTY